MRSLVLILLICLGGTDETENAKGCDGMCEKTQLASIFLTAKLDPSMIQATLAELKRVMHSDQPYALSAATYYWRLKEWSRFLTDDDPRAWSDFILDHEPTMVYVEDETCLVFYGGFAYAVGSQFQRTGWFITEITRHDMEMEHRGNEDKDATWEIKRIKFKKPYFQPLTVGPDGFSKMLRIPIVPIEKILENWQGKRRKP